MVPPTRHPEPLRTPLIPFCRGKEGCETEKAVDGTVEVISVGIIAIIIAIIITVIVVAILFTVDLGVVGAFIVPLVTHRRRNPALGYSTTRTR